MPPRLRPHPARRNQTPGQAATGHASSSGADPGHADSGFAPGHADSGCEVGHADSGHASPAKDAAIGGPTGYKTDESFAPTSIMVISNKENTDVFTTHLD